MRKPKKHDKTKTTTRKREGKELSTQQLEHVSGGVWVAYTDDGVTL